MSSAHTANSTPITELRPAMAHPMSASRVLLTLLAMNREAQNTSPNAGGGDEWIHPNILQTLLHALQYRDPHTWHHSRRVASLASELAAVLGWSQHQIVGLQVAALLHDIGKISVPDHVLYKPARFSPDEADLMSLHLRIGIDVLQACRVSPELLTIVGQAREFEDEPHPLFRKRGDTVHMGARILSVCDAYDSLRTDQVYRCAKTHVEAMRVLEHHAGRQFDGNIVRTLERWSQSPQGNYVQHSEDPASRSNVFSHLSAEDAERLDSLCAVFNHLYTLETLYDGFFIVDSDLRFITWNTGAEQLLGYEAKDMANRVWTSGLLGYSDSSGQPVSDGSCGVNQVLALQRTVAGATKMRHAQGHMLSLETQTIPLFNAEGQLKGVIEIFRDTAGKQRAPQAYRDLHIAATKDALTGLNNRGELERALHQLLGQAIAAGYHDPFSVVFLDVDFFKKINDTFGHAVGDTVLINVARLMQQETYSGEVIGRYGGEEFVIVCPGTGLSQAVKRAERIRQAVNRLQIPELKGKLISASFGVTQAEPGDSVHDMLERADKALYAAKHGGRNQTRSFTRLEFEHQESQGAVSKTPENETDSRIFRLLACMTHDIAGYKLGAYLSGTGARLLDHTDHSARMRLGRSGWFSRIDGDRGMPVIVEVQFGSATQNQREAGSLQSELVLIVRIQSERSGRNPELFEQRARYVLRSLCNYFAATEITQ